MIIVQRRHKGGGLPAGAYIFWYGNATDVPSEWVLESFASTTLAYGDSITNLTISGTSSHSHTNSPSGISGSHNHTASGSSSSPSGGIADVKWDVQSEYYIALNHVHSVSGTSSYDGSHSHTVSDSNSVSVLPPVRYLYLIKATKSAKVPVSGIIMWNGATSTIPDGFYICNGLNGTPDMSNNFVAIATSDAILGTSGGTTTHTHTNVSTGAAGGHSHTITLSFTGGERYYNATKYASDYHPVDIHSHSVATSAPSIADHTHSVGDTGSVAHLPLYYDIYFIMRGT